MLVISNWEKVTAIATAVGGVGAMIGAGAAWRAALASAATSRDARDALAASLKPLVQLRLTQEPSPGPVVARAYVVGPLSPARLAGVFPASNVRIDFNLGSGGHGSGSTPFLEPTESGLGLGPPYFDVVIAEPSAEWPAPGAIGLQRP